MTGNTPISEVINPIELKNSILRQKMADLRNENIALNDSNQKILIKLETANWKLSKAEAQNQFLETKLIASGSTGDVNCSAEQNQTLQKLLEKLNEMKSQNKTLRQENDSLLSNSQSVTSSRQKSQDQFENKLKRLEKEKCATETVLDRKIRELETATQELEKCRSESEVREEKLQLKLDSLKADFEVLQIDNHSLSQQVQKVSMKGDMETAMKTEIAKLKQETHQIEAKSNRYQQQIKLAELKIKDQQNALKIEQEKSSNSTLEISKLKIQLKECSEQTSSLQTQLNDVTSNNERLKHELQFEKQNYARELTSKQTQLDVLTREHQTLRENEMKIGQYDAMVSAFEKRIEQDGIKVASLNTAVSELTQTNLTLSQSEARLKSELETARISLSDLQNQLKQTKNALQTANENLDAKSNQLRTANENAMRVDSELKAVQNQKKLVEQARHDAHQLDQQHVKQLDKSKAEVDRLRTELEAAGIREAQLANELELETRKLTCRTRMLEAELAETHTRIKQRLEPEIARLSAQADATHTHNKQLEQSVAEARRAADSVRLDKEMAVERLSKCAEHSRRQSDHLQQTLAACKAEIAGLTSLRAKLEQQHRDAETRAAVQHDQLATCRAEQADGERRLAAAHTQLAHAQQVARDRTHLLEANSGLIKELDAACTTLQQLRDERVELAGALAASREEAGELAGRAERSERAEREAQSEANTMRLQLAASREQTEREADQCRAAEEQAKHAAAELAAAQASMQEESRARTQAQHMCDQAQTTAKSLAQQLAASREEAAETRAAWQQRERVEGAARLRKELEFVRGERDQFRVALTQREAEQKRLERAVVDASRAAEEKHAACTSVEKQMARECEAAQQAAGQAAQNEARARELAELSVQESRQIAADKQSLQRRVEEVRERQTELERERDELAARMTQRDAEAAKQQKRAEESAGQLKTVRRERDALARRVEQSEAECAQLEQRVEALAKLVAAKKRKIGELKEECASERRRHGELETQQQTRVNELERVLAAEKLGGAKKLHRIQVETEQHASSLAAQLSEKGEEVARLRGETRERADEIERCRQVIDEQEDRLVEWKRRADEKDHVLNVRQATIGRLEAKISQLERRIDQLNCNFNLELENGRPDSEPEIGGGSCGGSGGIQRAEREEDETGLHFNGNFQDSVQFKMKCLNETGGEESQEGQEDAESEAQLGDAKSNLDVIAENMSTQLKDLLARSEKLTTSNNALPFA